MATAKKVKGVLFLDKDKLECYISTTEKVFSLPFTPAVIKNIDIVDPVALTTLITSFIHENKLPLAAFTLILHETILFEKLITVNKPIDKKTPPPKQSATGSSPPAQPVQQTPAPSQSPAAPAVSPEALIPPVEQPASGQAKEDETVQIQHFIESIPFEDVTTTNVKSPEGTLVIGSNKALLMAIKESFEKNGFSVDAAIPATLFTKEVNLSNGFTLEIARELLAKADAYRDKSLPIEVKKESEPSAGTVSLGMPQRESERKRLFMLVGVFAVLIIIMVFFFFRMNAENAKIAQVPVPTPAAVVQTVPPTPTLSASTSAAEKQNLPVKISLSRQSASLSAQLQNSLRQKGYASITEVPGAEGSSSLIVFSESVPQDVQEEIATIVMALDSQAAVQFNQSPGVQILISL